MERKLDVVWVDTAAVVADANQADAAACQLNINRCRACVDAVFNDFFQGVGRAFDHFAGGDLVDKMVGQGSNSGHRFLSKSNGGRENYRYLRINSHSTRTVLFSCNTAVPSDS